MIPILYLSHCGSSIGGGENQLYNLVDNLDKNSYHPYIICPDDGIFADKLRNANIHTTVLNLPQWRKAKSLFTRYSSTTKLINFAKQHNIQLIHTSDSWLNPYLWKLKKSLNIPVISHVRNILNPTQIVKYDFDRMDHIVVISEQNRKSLLDSGIASDKIDLVLNCVDLSVFQPKPVKYENKSDPFVIGLVGRIEPFKRQKEFVEIASKVYHECQNVRFQIIGASLDAPKHKTYEREVRELVVKYKLDNCILFTGHQNDMSNVFHSIDLLVTLSAGSVIAEAMAAGLPVVATPIGSTTDMVVDGSTGWILPSDSIESISSKIVQLANDSELYTQMGDAARRHAEDNFNIEIHIKKIQTIYEQLLNNPNKIA